MWVDYFLAPRLMALGLGLAATATHALWAPHSLWALVACVLMAVALLWFFGRRTKA